MSSLPPLGPAGLSGPTPYRARIGPSKSLQKLSSGLPVSSGASIVPEKIRESLAGGVRYPRASAPGGHETISLEA